jgi:hypothetical protein
MLRNNSQLKKKKYQSERKLRFQRLFSSQKGSTFLPFLHQQRPEMYLVQNSWIQIICYLKTQGIGEAGREDRRRRTGIGGQWCYREPYWKCTTVLVTHRGLDKIRTKGQWLLLRVTGSGQNK